MSNLLLLVHRLPYPPNKGDKVRSYHLLKHLARNHRVFLGTFVDDAADERYVESVRALCTELYVARLSPRAARVRSLLGLVRGEPLTLPYYRDAGLRQWVQRTALRENIRTAVVYSSSMGQYVDALPELSVLMDFVDVDSAKWTQYSATHRWPLSWIYQREGERLLAYERALAARSVKSFFVTDAEVALFRSRAPECEDKVAAVGNGVDASYFSPQHPQPSPYTRGEVPIVFTGAMDYWPNVDAACWFAAEVLPQLRSRWPKLRFYVAGMRPAASVQALAGDAIVVTGTVPDVRPYLQHAAVVVAPLRVARGVQNKVLEAMAMGRPVVVSRSCAGAIEGASAHDFVPAGDAGEFVQAVDTLLRDPERSAAIGASARRLVIAHYSWAARLAQFDRYVHEPDERPMIALAEPA